MLMFMFIVYFVYLGRCVPLVLRARSSSNQALAHPLSWWTRCTTTAADTHTEINYSALRTDSQKNKSFSMASKDVRILCGAQICRCLQHFAMWTSNASKNNNIASRKTEVFLASAVYS